MFGQYDYTGAKHLQTCSRLSKTGNRKTAATNNRSAPRMQIKLLLTDFMNRKRKYFQRPITQTALTIVSPAVVICVVFLEILLSRTSNTFIFWMKLESFLFVPLTRIQALLSLESFNSLATLQTYTIIELFKFSRVFR